METNVKIATNAPYWKAGAITMMVIVFVLFCMLFLVQWLDRMTLAKEEIRLSELVIDAASVKGRDTQNLDVKMVEKSLVTEGKVAEVSGAVPAVL